MKHRLSGAFRHLSEPAAPAFVPSETDVCRSAAASKDTNPLDTAYAERLHALVTACPEDADILSQWAEAAVIAIKDDGYDMSSGLARPHHRDG